MSYPFESRAHAELRGRILLALGLLPACAEVTLLDDRDAGPDAGAISTDAGQANLMSPEGGLAKCEFGPPENQCFSRAALEQQAKWGVSMIPQTMPLRSDAEAQALFLANGCLPGQYVHNSCCNAASSEATVGADGMCCYAFCGGSCCGRPFIIQGKARMARAMRRNDWLCMLPDVAGRALPMALRERAAAEWLDDARMEHASVAAFARFTLELLAFGAPADLVGESQLAGLDEIEHARMCFALASRYAGADLGPAPLSMQAVAPAATLRESVLSAVIEGCIGETLAAARAQAALEFARDQATRTVLAKIADDETRHAELAYRYVAWALTREPNLASDIHELVRRESCLLSARADSLAPKPDVLEPALALLGRLSSARGGAVHDSTFAQVILPCIARLLEAHSEALSAGGTRAYSSDSLA